MLNKYFNRGGSLDPCHMNELFKGYLSCAGTFIMSIILMIYLPNDPIDLGLIINE